MKAFVTVINHEFLLNKLNHYCIRGTEPHSVHWGINPPSKTPPLSFLPSPTPLKSTNCPSPPFWQSPPLYIGFSPLLIPSYLLKVTKFLGKISQFEFLVMTETNSFAYKLYLSLNISDFNLFFM